MNESRVEEYGAMKVGFKTIKDAVLDIGALKTIEHNYSNKSRILKALASNNLSELRAISNYYYRVDGIYRRTCDYFAQLYRYDWYIVPELYDQSIKNTKVVTDFSRVLNFLDNSAIKKTCGYIALQVIKNGAYYGYKIESNNGLQLQELPVDYCRCRYSVANTPIVELNMKFFDEKFTDINYRMRVLKMMPKDIQRGYVLYKEGKLIPDYYEDTYGCWYALEPGQAIKFSFENGDVPLFANAIPAIIDLDAAQELDRRKQMQKLLKIIVQKLPMDKNGDLIFDIEEAKDIHNNAVTMLSRAVGVDILTTFTDVESIDLADAATTTSKDDLEKVERTVFNNLGISQNLFNTDGNLSLEKSILNDEGSCRTLLLQLAAFYDAEVQRKSANKKKYNFRLYMLETTQYNYKELSKMYKEQVQIGYSKMLPQIALGHSQSFILNSVYFENKVLELNEIMVPPLMSSTMSSEDVLGNKGNSDGTKSQNNTESDSAAGRPEKPDDEKSEKTIANKESMN